MSVLQKVNFYLHFNLHQCNHLLIYEFVFVVVVVFVMIKKVNKVMFSSCPFVAYCLKLIPVPAHFFH